VDQLGKKKKTKEKLTSDGIWSYSGDYGDLNVGTLSESMSVDFGDLHTQLNLDFDDEKLKNKYPALKDAWEHYNNVLDMCRAKEKEDEN
jgi:hypothetical protein